MSKPELNAIFLRHTQVYPVLFSILIICSIWFHNFPIARAASSYAPGVKAGDTMTYGIVSVNNYPFAPFNNLTSLETRVDGVNTSTNTVNATLFLNYPNGTTKTQQLSGRTDTGQGNLFPYILAAGIQPGDPAFNNPQQAYPGYIVNASLNLFYAGAVRTVDAFTQNVTGSYSASISFNVDQATGLLLEVSVNQTFTGFQQRTNSLHFKATATNAWSPENTPDYTLSIVPPAATIYLGASTSLQLLLSSINNFTDTVDLSPSLIFNNATSQLKLAITPASLNLSSTEPTATSSLEISTNSTTKLGVYEVILNATSTTVLHQDRLLVHVIPPDFAITSDPKNLTILPGGSKTSILTISSLGDFVGTVSLFIYSSQPGVSTSLTRSQLILNSTISSASTVLNVTVAPNTLPALSSVTIQAQAPNTSHSVYLPVNVTGPDFTITANPQNISLKQGTSATSTISLTSHDGFSGPVTLTTPYGFSPLTATLSPSTLTLTSGGTSNATLTVLAGPAVPPGYYYGYVVATAPNGLSHSVFLNLIVTGPDFTFTTSTYQATIKAGKSALATLNLSRVENFNGTVQLSTSTFGELQANPSQQQVTLNSTSTTATVSLNITVSSGSTAGYGNVQILATSGILSHSLYISVQIIAPDFQVTATPFSTTINEGGSGQETISVTSLNNFSGNLTLTTQSQFPTSFTSTSLKLSPNATATTTLTISVPTGTSPGYYYITVSATNGTLTRSTSFQVIVVGPDFTLSVSPGFLSLQEGGTGNVTVTVSSIDNLSGLVTISAQSFNGILGTLPPTSILAISANSTSQTSIEIFANAANPGFYTVQITAVASNLVHSYFLSVQVVGPDFSVIANPGFLSLRPGTSAQVTLSLSSIDNFSGNVSFSIPFAIGVTGSLANSTVNLSRGGTASTALTVTALVSDSGSGYFSITVNATSGRLFHTSYITVQVITPDFSITSIPSSITMRAGTTATTTLTLTSLNGFNGTITLFAFSANGINGTFNEQFVTLTGGASVQVTLTLTASNSSGGQQIFLTVQGVSGNLYRQTFISITVVGPSFALTVLPQTVILRQGASSTATVTIASTDGFAGNVSLSVPFTYPPLFYSFSPQSVQVPNGGSATSTITINVPSTAPLGFFTVPLVGTSGQARKTTYFEIQISTSPYTVAASPSFIFLTRGQSANSTLTVTGQFTGQITLAESSSRSGLNLTISPTTVSLSGNGTSSTSTLTITVPANSNTGDYTITVEAVSGSLNQTATITVIVAMPDFYFYAATSHISVFQGSSNTVTLTISSLFDFTGPVQLNSTSSDPTALKTSLSPSLVRVALSSQNSITLTVSASTNASLTTDFVEVSAISNETGIIHSIQIAVDVIGVPDFKITATPTAVSFVQNSSATSGITLTSINNFQGFLTLSATVTPAGPTAVIAPGVFLSGSMGVTSTISSGTNNAGHFAVTVTATDLNLVNATHSVTIQVFIAPAPDFTLSAPSTLTLVSGHSTTGTAALSSLNNFTGTISLGAVSSTQFLSTSFNPQQVQLAPLNSSFTTFNVTSFDTPPGQYTIKILADAGSLEHVSIVSITVLPAPDFTLTTPTRVTISAGATTSTTITISPLNGFNGPVTFSLNGLTDFAGGFSPNPVVGGSGASNLTITASSSIFVGNYTVTVVAVGGTVLHASSFTVTVNATSPVPVSTKLFSWNHRVSIKAGGLETWTVSVTNNAKIPVYVQAVTFVGPGPNASIVVRSAVVKIMPGATTIVTQTYTFSLAQKYSFMTVVNYSTVVDPSMSLIGSLSLNLGKGSFTVGK